MSSYTEEQRRYYNTKPTTEVVYTTIKLTNPIFGVSRLVAADKNGPYIPMRFNDGGTMEEFVPTFAEVPKVAIQDTTTDDVGQIKLAGVAFDANDMIEKIARNADTFAEKVISVTLSVYKNPSLDPIYTVDTYVGIEGISIGDFDVVMRLQFSNPSKTPYAPFYDPDEYKGLLYG